MFDIITFGSATTDVFVDTESPEIQHGKEEMIAYTAGSKILIKKINFLIGGCAVNTAIGFARLGLKTGCISRLGDNNSSILYSLKKEGVAFLGKKTKGIGGYSVILDSKEHNRTILTYRGLNDEISFKELKIGKIKTRWLYLAASLKQSLKTEEMLMKFARKNGIKIAFNPSAYQIKQYRRRVKRIVKNADVLIFNKEEAEALTGKTDIKSLLKKSFLMGAKTICITDGQRGSWVYDGRKFFFLEPHNIRVVERTGAGDAFSAGFVAGLIKKKDIEYALQLGLANAESVIKYHGAQNKLLSWNEIASIIKKNPARIRKDKDN